jgi:putative nucleotidyltransferase with HDIG domain
VAERILVVEDDEFMRASLQMELEGAGFQVAVAQNGIEAINLTKEENFDLIICDVRMPGMNGLTALTAIKEYQPMARNIVITGYASPDAPVQALKMKVDDYLLKPFSSEEFLRSVRASLEQYRACAGREGGAFRFKESFLRILSGIVFESRISHLVGHSERVARLALQMARDLGFSSQRTMSLYLAALLHDIGQMEVPQQMLEKDRLGEEEIGLIKNHPALARDLLEPFKEMKDVSTIIFHHHEKWDGTGYPRGLRAERIPLESRILALAEAYDSLVSERPYRSKKGSREALRQLEKEAGTSFDPHLVKIFAKLHDLYRSDAAAESKGPGHDDPHRAAFLLNLADTYREIGNYDVALTAYSQANDLLAGGEPPELYVRLLMGKSVLLECRGDLPEALALIEEALAYARQRDLDSARGQFLLQKAHVHLLARDGIDLTEIIEQAREIFTVWESSYDLCRADFFLAVWFAAEGSSEDAFGACWRSFVQKAGAAGLLDIAARYRDHTFSASRFSLARSQANEETAGLLRAGGAWAIDVLERLLEADDTVVRLRTLDILGTMKEQEARALLSRARLDTDAIVAGKSSVLLSHRPQPVAEPLLQIFFFGRFRVLVGDSPLDDDVWVTRKIRSLFAYLASRRGDIINEERLMDLFWEQGGEKARHSLHNSISQIRRVLAPHLGPGARKAVVNRKDGYMFNREIGCFVDLEAFDLHCHKGRLLKDQGRWDEALAELQKAERLYRGDFLEGSYEEWSDDLRLKCQTKYAEALQTLAQYFLDRKKYEVSIDYWKKILARDNCLEDAYLGLMQCHVLAGRQNEAIRTYHQCVQTLKKELDLAPAPSIVEYYLRLVHGPQSPP